MPAVAFVAAPRRPDPRRIAPLIAAVVAAHALLLALPRQVPVASGLPLAPQQAVQVRMVDKSPSDDKPQPAPIASLDEAAPTRVVERADASPAIEPLPPLPPVETVSAAPAAPVAPPAPAWLGMALPGVPTEDDRFFARSLLSVPPVPLQPVLIDYPSFAGDAGRYVSELSLFIDETGAVVKVRVDGDPLPPALEAAAQSAFLNARFRPGEAPELGVVKSRIRVEVTFDSRSVGTAGG